MDEEGRQRGRVDGQAAGFREGYQLGLTTALEYGMEIGFIRGVMMALCDEEEEEKVDIFSLNTSALARLLYTAPWDGVLDWLSIDRVRLLLRL